MRTTLTLDDDVSAAALAHSRATGKRLGRVLSEMARQALRPAPGPSPQRRRKKRFPGFALPPDAPAIPASRIQTVLDEDGVV